MLRPTSAFSLQHIMTIFGQLSAVIAVLLLIGILIGGTDAGDASSLHDNSLEDYLPMFGNQTKQQQHQSKIKGSGSKPTLCVDPSVEELKNELANGYRMLLNKIQEGIELYPPVQQKYSRFILEPSTSAHTAGTQQTSHTVRIYGSQQCNKIEQTQWRMYDVSICPHHFVELKRADRYPFYMKHAVCNCRKCLGVNSFAAKCSPVNVARPVLERQECSTVTGVYKWKFSMEYVPVSCTCSQHLDID